MKLTETQLRAIYVMLTCCPPFSRWKLPDEYRLKFKVTRSDMHMGMYEPDPHRLAISAPQHTGLAAVVETMAHELIHLKLEREGRQGHADHGPQFKAHASEVCKAWGFDESTF